jgi:hypothetical protein
MNKPITIGLAAVATAGVAFTAFALSDNSAQDAADYASKPTVTVTSTAPPEPATTTTLTIEATPADCLQALTDADAALALSGEGYDILGDALEAAGNLDAASVATATQNMSLFNKRLTVVLATYKTSRDACKAAN